MRTIRTGLLALGLLALTILVTQGPGSEAQTTLNSTTTATAVGATDDQVRLASTSNVSVGDRLVIDDEGMTVRTVSSPVVTVTRGQRKTHARGAKVWTGANARFFSDVPSGSCTATSELYTPHIVLNAPAAGRTEMYDCSGGFWAKRVSGNAYAVGGDRVDYGDVTLAGRRMARDSFEQGYFIHQDDLTAKSLTDNENNIVHGSPLGLISYREELTKTVSSWVIADGTLDISADDTTDNDGVEFVFGGNGSTTTEGVIVAGTSGACLSASITIADISGTDQVQIGWRQNEAFEATNLNAYTVWNTVGVNNVDGSIMSSQEVGEATDTDDSGVNYADAETRLLKVCISAAGVPTAFYTAASGNESAYVPITMTETGSTLTAGVQLWPYLTYMAAGTDGADVVVNWIQLEAAQ